MIDMIILGIILRIFIFLLGVSIGYVLGTTKNRR